MRRNGIALIILALLVVGAASWWFTRSNNLDGSGIRNVLLISIDTCRADYLSCYGYEHATTPNIDKLAAEGVLFENALSPVPLTLPAHSTMLTGSIPPYHGVHDNQNHRLGDANVTLAEILKEVGFSTAAVIAAVVLDSRFGLNQGFDTYDDQFDQEHNSIGIVERRGQEVTRHGLNWLAGHRSERFFLFLHYYDPHATYMAPKKFGAKFPHSSYAAEIAYTDHCIGQVISGLKKLDLYDSTLIILTSDHGEMLGEHKETTHGYFVYQSVVHVPLIVRVPGEKQPRRVEKLVGLVDIAPTVCDLLSIEPPQEMKGRSVLAKPSANDTERAIYCESVYPTLYNASPLLAVVTPEWKYIHTTRPELYDLNNDPAESNNLVADKPQQASRLKDRLAGILRDQHREGDLQKIDRSMIRQLESLGYVGGSRPTAFEIDMDLAQEHDDPKDLINFHTQMGKVLIFTHLEKYVEAGNICRQLLETRPDVAYTHFHMGLIAREQNDMIAAIGHYQDGLDLDDDQPDAHSDLAMLLAKEKRFEEAVAHCRRALELEPDLIEAHVNMGTALHNLNRPDESMMQYRRALELDPHRPEVHRNLALLLVESQKVDEAIHHLRKAVQSKPEFFEARNSLAEVLSERQEYGEAISHYRESLKAQPDQINILNNLAWLLATCPDPTLRRPDEAVEKTNRAIELIKNPNAPLLDTLAAAYAAANRFDLAVKHAQAALDLVDPGSPNANEIDRHLQLYRQGKPYQESSAPKDRHRTP